MHCMAHQEKIMIAIIKNTLHLLSWHYTTKWECYVGPDFYNWDSGVHTNHSGIYLGCQGGSSWMATDPSPLFLGKCWQLVVGNLPNLVEHAFGKWQFLIESLKELQIIKTFLNIIMSRQLYLLILFQRNQCTLIP